MPTLISKGRAGIQWRHSLISVIFESEDIKARRRAADTSPIRYYPTDDPD